MSAPNVVPLARPSQSPAPQAIDRRITVTVFPDKFARTKREVVMRFRNLPVAMGKRTALSKDTLPYLKLALFGDELSQAKCLRTNANMLAIGGVEAITTVSR